MSSENIILQSMELFPAVLETIIIEYITRKEITFRPFNKDNKQMTISEDGRTLSVKSGNRSRCHAAISPTPFSQCRLRWKIELLCNDFQCYIGVAFPNCKANKANLDDVADVTCVYFSFWCQPTDDDDFKKYISIPSNPAQARGGEHGSKHYFGNTCVVMEVDLIQSTWSIYVDESDRMIQVYCNNEDHITTGKIPIATNIQNLEQCFPFISLSSQDSCKLVVTSY